MTERLSIDALQGVPATLLIPLFGRARARRDFPQLGFADPGAEAIVDRLALDPKPYARDRLTLQTAIERARVLDEIARGFFARYPGAQGASLGAGLCTRFSRIDDGALRWLDVDLPEVISLKRQLVEPGPRYRLHEGSIFEPSWIDALAPRGPALLISEGVLIYFPREEVRRFLALVADRFPAGTELAIDFAHPLTTLGSRFHPLLSRVDARFDWSASGARAVAALEPRFERVGAHDVLGRGLPGQLDRLLRATTGRSFYGVAHLKLRG